MGGPVIPLMFVEPFVHSMYRIECCHTRLCFMETAAAAVADADDAYVPGGQQGSLRNVACCLLSAVQCLALSAEVTLSGTPSLL